MSWAGVAWWIYRAQARAGVGWQVGRDLVDWWTEVWWAVALWACRVEAWWDGGQLPCGMVAQQVYEAVDQQACGMEAWQSGSQVGPWDGSLLVLQDGRLVCLQGRGLACLWGGGMMAPQSVGLVGLWGRGLAGQQPGLHCPGRPVRPRPGGLWPGCSFSKSWCVEAFHVLRVQGAKVSALPGALPYPSLSPAFQQGSQSMEFMQSVFLSQLSSI
jgi:hypothetical protein